MGRGRGKLEGNDKVEGSDREGDRGKREGMIERG